MERLHSIFALAAVGSTTCGMRILILLVEPTTKEEREDGLKLPIIGNGREYVNTVGQPQRQQQTAAPTTTPAFALSAASTAR